MSRTQWSPLLSDLVKDLEPIAPQVADTEFMPKALDEFAESIGVFKRDLKGLSSDDFARLLPLSRETPTHFKWNLFSAPDGSYRIWLHEYKDAATRLPGYAQTIHNHRYAFASLILAGGYLHSRFKVETSDDLIAARPQPIATSEIFSGARYALSSRDFHSVTAILDGTVSLVIQWSSCNAHSVSVDPSTRRAVRHYPIESRFDILRSVFD